MIRDIEFILEDLASSTELGEGWNEYQSKTVKPWVTKYIFFKKRIYANDGSKVCFLLRLRYNKRSATFRLKVKGNLAEWYFGHNTNKDLTLKQYEQGIKQLSRKIGLANSVLWEEACTASFTIGINMQLKNLFKDVYSSYAWSKLSKSSDEGSLLKYNYRDLYLDYYFTFYNIENEKKEQLQRSEVGRYSNEKCDFMRFEVKIDRASDITFFFDYSLTLSEIRKNWNEMPRKLIDCLNSIKFNDKIVKTDVLKKMSVYELVDYLKVKKPEIVKVKHVLYIPLSLYMKGHKMEEGKEAFRIFTECVAEDAKLRNELLKELINHVEYNS